MLIQYKRQAAMQTVEKNEFAIIHMQSAWNPAGHGTYDDDNISSPQDYAPKCAFQRERAVSPQQDENDAPASGQQRPREI